MTWVATISLMSLNESMRSVVWNFKRRIMLRLSSRTYVEIEGSDLGSAFVLFHVPWVCVITGSLTPCIIISEGVSDILHRQSLFRFLDVPTVE